jgi:hypothetical protein
MSAVFQNPACEKTKEMENAKRKIFIQRKGEEIILGRFLTKA